MSCTSSWVNRPRFCACGCCGRSRLQIFDCRLLINRGESCNESVLDRQSASNNKDPVFVCCHLSGLSRGCLKLSTFDCRLASLPSLLRLLRSRTQPALNEPQADVGEKGQRGGGN